MGMEVRECFIIYFIKRCAIKKSKYRNGARELIKVRSFVDRWIASFTLGNSVPNDAIMETRRAETVYVLTDFNFWDVSGRIAFNLH